VFSGQLVRAALPIDGLRRPDYVAGVQLLTRVEFVNLIRGDSHATSDDLSIVGIDVDSRAGERTRKL
jgi:hypothetical protein